MTINDYTLDEYAADIADEILRECEGERDDSMDRAHMDLGELMPVLIMEAADGSEWAIYYSKAHELCQNCNTDNGHLYFEDCGPWEDVTYDRIACIIAYGELRARIEQAIDAKIDEAEAA